MTDFNKSLEVEELPTARNLIYNNRGTTFAKKGQLEQALADFESAVHANPGDALAYRNRALAHKKLGNAEQAKVDFAKAKELGGM